MIPLAKLFFTLDTMNLLSKLHESVYEVIHVDKKRIFTDKKIFKWAEENELINFVEFKKIYDSFDTNNKILYAKNLTIKSQITGTPYLMISGKYLTGPSLISKSNGGFSPARLEQVVKQLYKNKSYFSFSFKSAISLHGIGLQIRTSSFRCSVARFFFPIPM